MKTKFIAICLLSACLASSAYAALTYETDDGSWYVDPIDPAPTTDDSGLVWNEATLDFIDPNATADSEPAYDGNVIDPGITDGSGSTTDSSGSTYDGNVIDPGITDGSGSTTDSSGSTYDGNVIDPGITDGSGSTTDSSGSTYDGNVIDPCSTTDGSGSTTDTSGSGFVWNEATLDFIDPNATADSGTADGNVIDSGATTDSSATADSETADGNVIDSGSTTDSSAGTTDTSGSKTNTMNCTNCHVKAVLSDGLMYVLPAGMKDEHKNWVLYMDYGDRVMVMRFDGSTMELQAGTAFTLQPLESGNLVDRAIGSLSRTWLHINKLFTSNKFEVKTPASTAVIRG